MKVRFYIAPQIGTGTMQDPFRSAVNNYINAATGEWFDEIDNPSRRISLVCVHAPQVTHDAIAADSTIIAIGDPVEETNIKTSLLDIPISSLQNVSGLKTKLESVGISTSWYSADNTVRDGIRYLMRIFFIGQIADGEGNSRVKTFIANNLDTTINQIPAAIRNAASDWMLAKGLATGWITSTTTVRQVLHFIVTNLGFGLIKMSQEGF